LTLLLGCWRPLLDGEGGEREGFLILTDGNTVRRAKIL
jgi:hypothetical protein